MPDIDDDTTAPVRAAAAAPSSASAAATGIDGGGESDADLRPIPPSEVPEDLRHIQDWRVVAQIVRRRHHEDAVREEKVGVIRAEEARKAAEADERFRIRQEEGARLSAWATEPGGAAKGIRALLAGLADVLWEDAKWTPVTMAQLIDPNKVKIYFRKAQLVTHTDKQKDASLRQKYVAETIFDTLSKAWERFEAGEGAGR